MILYVGGKDRSVSKFTKSEELCTRPAVEPMKQLAQVIKCHVNNNRKRDLYEQTNVINNVVVFVMIVAKLRS